MTAWEVVAVALLTCVGLTLLLCVICPILMEEFPDEL